MNYHAIKILQHLETHGATSEKEINKLHGIYFAANSLVVLQKKGYISRIDKKLSAGTNLPDDAIAITTDGINYLEEQKFELRWRLIPLAINTLLSIAAIIISIIALSTP